jgi:hypothetical protein
MTEANRTEDPYTDEFDTRDSEAAVFREEHLRRNDEWAAYTGWDFLQDSLRQQREMQEAHRQWLNGFLADQKRVMEWKL